MRRIRKKYQTPKHPWQAQRIKEEAELVKKYGLKNKKEVWRAISLLRNWRAQARKLVGLSEEDRIVKQKELFAKLTGLGVLTTKSDLDDILGLNVESVLDLRLQTLTFKRGLSATIKQARQFIAHGKVVVNDKVINSPSYLVRKIDKLSLLDTFKPKLNIAKAKEEPVVKAEAPAKAIDAAVQNSKVEITEVKK